METNSTYFSEIVYLRAIATLAVISIHTSAYFTKMSTINFLTLIYMSIDAFSFFAVPLFICISGFVLYHKYRWPFSLQLFYKKRFTSVVPQYLIFSTFAIISTYLFNISSGKTWDYGTIDIIYLYLTGKDLGHLWFFLLIIQLYVIYPIIEKIFMISVKKQKTHELLFLSLIFPVFFQLVHIQNPPLFLSYLCYFILGMYVRSHYPDIKNVVMIQKNHYILFIPLLCGTLWGISNWCKWYFRYDPFPQLTHFFGWISPLVNSIYYILIFYVCLFIAIRFSEKNSGKGTQFLQIIGRYSFRIYLVQGFIIFALASILFPKSGFDVNNWLFYPVVFSLVLILSLGLVYFIKKLPYYEFIIGNTR